MVTECFLVGPQWGLHWEEKGQLGHPLDLGCHLGVPFAGLEYPQGDTSALSSSHLSLKHVVCCQRCDAICK